MQYQTLLTRIIEDGIAEVRKAYADPKEHHKRDGAIAGFEACRGKSPGELVALYYQVEREAETARRAAPPSDETARSFWRLRYKALQVEWCINVVSFGMITSGHRKTGLLLHLPTARAASKYAQIVGVQAGNDPVMTGVCPGNTGGNS